MKLSGTNKRYYWLKLPEDFFRQKEIKQLRRIAGGDTFTIIYLKMLLRSLKDDGRLYYEGIEQDFISEIALDIDEDEENVKVTVAFLLSKGILIQSHSDEYELTSAKTMTGCESFSAERMRRMREKKLIASHSDAPLSLCDAPVTLSDAVVTACDEEIEKEKEIEKSKRKDIPPSLSSREIPPEGVTLTAKSKRKSFIKPTLEELQAFCDEIDYNLDCQFFLDFYEDNGWMTGPKNNRRPVSNWKLTVRSWEKRDKERGLDTRANSRRDREDDPCKNMSPEAIAELERLANDGYHWG